MNNRCEIISVGTELLLGNIANTDAQDISQAMSELGINVYWHTVVGDNPKRLSECVEIAKSRADIIITTGGLGPTYDDLTKNTLAAAFGKKLIFDPEEAKRIENHFMTRAWSTPMTENNYNQAYLPEGCTKLPNTCGTAPGCAFEAEGVTVIMLPGPRNECRTMLRLAAMPYLAAKSDVVLKSHNIHVFGMNESTIEDKLHNLMQTMTNPTLAPYAKTGEVMLRLTARGKNEGECESLMAPYLEKVKDVLGDTVYSVDIESMEETVVKLLGAENKSAASIESSTGGLFSKRITDVSGFEKVFAGGLTVQPGSNYGGLPGLDKVKTEGREAAVLFSQCARSFFGADYGVGISGEIDTQTAADADKVGVIYVAVCCDKGSYVRRTQLGTYRERTRIVSASHAFDLLRRLASDLAPNADKID